MRYLLPLLLFMMIGQDLFNIRIGLGPGITLENAVLYAIALTVGYRMLMGQQAIELKSLQAAFVVMIIYAFASFIVAAFAVDYKYYRTYRAALTLKNNLIDYLVFFVAFFYAARTTEDASKVLRLMLALAAFVSFACILTGFGIYGFSTIEVDAGRLQGVVGEANQLAAFVLLFLPALVATVITVKGKERLLWLAGALFSSLVILMTASRGAFVGLIVCGLLGAVIYRRFISMGRIFVWTVCLALVGSLIIAIVLNGEYGDLLRERLVRQSQAGDARTLTSGRTYIWATAIARMAQDPISFISGFGWDVYRSMPFRYATHNHYLLLWFDLGLVGLTMYLAIMWRAIKTSYDASLLASGWVRSQLVAAVFGLIGLAVAVFFVNLFESWRYVWAYVGIVMRLAVNAGYEHYAAQAVAKPRVKAEPASRQDAFGWASPKTPKATR